MMKKIYFLVIAFFPFVINAQIVTIPDAAFKSMLVNHFPVIDANGDGEIQLSEASAVTTLTLSFNTVVLDLTGIRMFSNLTDLQINNLTNLPAIDLHGMPNLENVQLSNCYNTVAIDVSGLNGLRHLWINSSFALNSVNVSGTNNVTEIHLDDLNSLPAFDFLGMTQLESLSCSSLNMMPSINLSGLTNLQSITIRGLSFTSFNPAGLTALTNFDCEDSMITALDFSGNANLMHLSIRFNSQLTSLNLSGLSQLETVDCRTNNLSALQLAGNTNLTSLDCHSNHITSLSLSGLLNLSSLECSANELSTLNPAGLNALTYLGCGDNYLTTLNVSSLTNLTSLICTNNYLTALNVNTLTNLISLGCGNNALGGLNVTALINLTSLAFPNIGASAVDLSTLHNLENLDTSNNPLNTVDFSTMPNLISLACNNNNLTTVNVSAQPLLQSLYCSGNQLTSMILNPDANYFSLFCGSNPFTSLDLSNYHFSHLDLYQCQNLTYLNLKNGDQNFLSLDAPQCPNLTYVCANESNVPNLIAYFEAQLQMTTVQVNSYCAFTPGGNYNTIAGIFTLDSDNNGCDSADIHPSGIRVGINDGTQTGATFTTAENYSFYTQGGNFVLTPSFQNPYFSISPTSATLNFASVNNSVQTQNFCVTPLGVHNDLEITLIPASNPRPGFDVGYYLRYTNKGNQVQSGTINFTYDDSVFDLVSATPATTSQTANVLHWDYANLRPFDSGMISIILNLNGPTETPAVNIGDTLNFSTVIDPASGDETPLDNVSACTQTVTGSYDPNDKICLEGNSIAPEQVGKYLHYTIHFQNSGTAPAENVVVKDVIDTSKFDIATLQLTASSHPQQTRITGDKVEFIFENINLPAEIVDEPGSHGYVAFKIKTKDNLVLGNDVANTANIYFDYNFPITTNTATTSVALLAKDAFEDKSVSIFPNPVTNKLHITAKQNITYIQLYDSQGRLIETNPANGTEAVFDVSGNANGVYFVKIYTEKGIAVEKLLKE